MRAGLHATITIVFTVLATIASLVGAVVVTTLFLSHGWLIPGAIVAPLILVVGLFLPSVFMTRVPCKCPKCGSRAKYGFAAFGTGISPKFAWSCTACSWSTYRWSEYQQNRLTHRR